MIPWLALGCRGAEPAASDCPPSDVPLLWLSTTDYEVGALAALDPATGVVYDELSSAWPDALVRVREGVAIAIGRGQADAIRVYGDRCFAAPDSELPLHPGTNAHDVERVGSAWFATSFEQADLLAIDDAGRSLGAVDLAPWADDDGLPEADQLVVAGDELVVALQNLDRDGEWAAGIGRLAIVDPASLTVARVFDVGPNPKLFAHPADPGSAVVLTGVYFDLSDGAVETVDLATGTVDVVRTEADFQLDLSDYAEIGGVGVVVGVSVDDGSRSALHCIDWATGAWTAGLVTDSFLADLTGGPDGLVWVVARSGVAGGPSGVFAVDPATCAVASDWLQTTLEPYSIAVLP